MIAIAEFCIRTRLERPVVEAWIEAGWLIPPPGQAELIFAEIDVARAQLIAELRGDLGVNDEGVGVVLHLLDQVHDLRRVLADVLVEVREMRRAP